MKEKLDFKFNVLEAQLATLNVAEAEVRYVGKLIILLLTNEGICTNNDLFGCWTDLGSDMAIHRKLTYLKEHGVIFITKDKKDKRKRLIKLQFNWVDSIIQIEKGRVSMSQNSIEHLA